MNTNFYKISSIPNSKIKTVDSPLHSFSSKKLNINLKTVQFSGGNPDLTQIKQKEKGKKEMIETFINEKDNLHLEKTYEQPKKSRLPKFNVDKNHQKIIKTEWDLGSGDVIVEHPFSIANKN